MPRSLSGVRSGEFDTIEVTEKMTAQDLETTGRFQHTADDANLPAEFSYLNIGETGDTGVRLKVFGNLEVTGATTTSGLEAALTFKASDGTVLERYDGGSTKDFQLPAPTAPSTLTIKQGTTTLGTYDTTGSDTTITIPTPPRPTVASLTHSSDQSATVTETTTLLMSGYGLTLTPTASTSYLIEVQVFGQNSTANNDSEELTLTLTTDTESVSNHHAADTIFFAKSGKQLLKYQTVLTLVSGTHEVGLAFHTEDDDDGNNVSLLFGGDFPDVIMSATEVDHSSTQYSTGF